jgi:transketolase
MQVADTLAAEGIRTRVLSMPTIKPLDNRAVEAAAYETRGILTFEEHSTVGGLGSAVADVLAELPTPRALLAKWAAPDRLHHRVGTQEYMRQVCGDPIEKARGLLLATGAARTRA